MEDGPGLLPFKLGSAKVVSHYHSFIQPVNLDTIRENLESVRLQLNQVAPQINNKTSSLYQPHLEYLGTKIEKLFSLLESFEPNRSKRGLIDGIGSIIKSISGNLDYTDAIKYDNAIKLLKENENKIAAEINSHMSLSKNWMTQNSDIITSLVRNQEKLGQAINNLIGNTTHYEADLIRYAHLAQYLLIISDNIESLSEELLKLGNLLAFIRANSSHHSILNFEQYKKITNKLNTLYKGDGLLLDVNFREFLDIIKLGYYYNDKMLVIVLKVPITYPKPYDLYKLAIAPNRNNKAIIPSYPYIAIHDEDIMYMEAECPKYNSRYLCEDKPSHHLGKQRECLRHLLLGQQIVDSCQYTSVIITTAAMEKLDDIHYVINLPIPTKIHLACSQNQYTTIHGSFLVTIPKGCSIRTPDFLIINHDDRIKGQALTILDPSIIEEQRHISAHGTIKLNSMDLAKLHNADAEITLEPRIDITQPQIDSLYHTTIPIYSILFVASALCIGYLIRRYYVKSTRKNNQIESNKNVAENQDVYAEIEEKKTPGTSQPSLSALFSTKVLK